MIWDEPIHRNRLISAWVGHPDVGITKNVQALIAKAQVSEKITPSQFDDGRIVAFASIRSIDKVATILKTLAPYADTAMWMAGEGLRANLMKKSLWLDCEFKLAYRICDILVISNIPSALETNPYVKADRQEVNNIVRERAARGRTLTMLIGPNQGDLEAFVSHNVIQDALDA